MSKVNLEKMSKCPSCGATLEPSATYCKNCGSYFISAEDAEEFSKEKFLPVLNSSKENGVIYIHGWALDKGEYPIYSGLANLYRGMLNAAGGRLVLTNRRFLFIDHGFNWILETKPEEASIYFEDVAGVESKTVMLLSKRLVVKKKNGTVQEYVVWNLKKWMNAVRNVLPNI